MSKVAFVIRTLDEGRTLDAVLERVARLTGDFSREIVVVDSGSTDATLEVARRRGARILEIDRSEWSWGRALNRGIEATSAEVVVILSGHCFLSRPDFLSVGLGRLTEDASVAALYGRQLRIPGVNPFEEHEPLEAYPDLVAFRMRSGAFEAGKVVGVSNACCVLRRCVWEEERFDETLESLEDGDWALRVLRTGRELEYSSRLAVYHSHPLDARYLYRKHYWRRVESLRFQERLPVAPAVRLRRAVRSLAKKAAYRPVQRLRGVFGERAMRWALMDYPFIQASHVKAYWAIRARALGDANRDHGRGRRSSYWGVRIPEPIQALQATLAEVQPLLRTIEDGLRDPALVEPFVGEERRASS